MEKRTSRIHIKIAPSVKAAAQNLASNSGRTLSNYIEHLLLKEIKKEREKMKFYNKITDKTLTQKEYDALIEREAKDFYQEYLDTLDEDEDAMSFAQYCERLRETESDFVAVED